MVFVFGIKVSLTSRLQKKKGVAFGNVKGILFPSFGIGERGGISVNFGKSSFVYDIDAHDWAVGESAAAVAAENQTLSRIGIKGLIG